MVELIYFEPQPRAAELPALFPSPFDEGPPQRLAARAAEALQRELASGFAAPGVSLAGLEAPAGGKMFGVLVVVDGQGRVGFLRAFSGMLAGRWDVAGFAAPLFDRAEWAALEPAGEAVVSALFRRCASLLASSQWLSMGEATQALLLRQGVERTALQAKHAARRAHRHDQRAATEREASERGAVDAAAALQALAQESRADKAELRRLLAAQEQEAAVDARAGAGLRRRAGALERLRRMVSRGLMRRLHETYRLVSAAGETCSLRTLYAPREPPSGAGDCAAAKLLGAAYRLGLRPLALAELWWGEGPLSGGRLHGCFYPACREKCGPLLPFLLAGLPLAEPSPFRVPALAHEPLPVVYEDEWIVVVDKPAGLLSVPGRDARVTDSVQARLRRAYPLASGPLLVHRLDLDTSGLLVAAKDAASHAALQRQFAARTVHKRYLAWVEGSLRGDAGRIELALRVDVQDRPRQVHDPVHGKSAQTQWSVLRREAGRTLVGLSPLTGRTHQLRVHAAHPLGLGAPIVGDRLYGHGGERLLLHAERLELTHPHTGQRLVFTSAAPF